LLDVKCDDVRAFKGQGLEVETFQVQAQNLRYEFLHARQWLPDRLVILQGQAQRFDGLFHFERVHTSLTSLRRETPSSQKKDRPRYESPPPLCDPAEWRVPGAFSP